MRQLIIKTILGGIAVIMTATGVMHIYAESPYSEAKRLEDEKKFEKALKKYETGLRRHSEYKSLFRAGVLSFTLSADEESNKKEEYIEKGLVFAEKAREARPKDSEVWQLSGRIAFLADKRDASRRFFEKAIELDPYNHLDYYFDLAQLELRSGNTESARRVVDSALEKYPESAVDKLENQREKRSSAGRRDGVSQLSYLKALRRLKARIGE